MLQCGDPSATGAGCPGYRFANEYPTNQYRLIDPALHQVVRYPRFVLGAEVCGTVEAVGDGVTVPRLGDGVTTADAVGAYAEYCFAPADIGTSVPDGVTSDIAAAAILKGMTAHSSDQVGVSGGAGRYGAAARGGGGVNLVLTQWATSLGAESSPLPPSRHKAALSRRAGAVEVLDYPDDPQQFGAKVRELTGGKGVAAVYDGVGKSTFDGSLASLPILGTQVLFGAASGPVPPFDPAVAPRRRLGVSDPPVVAPFHTNSRRVYLAYRRIV